MGSADVVVFHAPSHTMSPKRKTPPDNNNNNNNNNKKSRSKGATPVLAMVSMEQPKYATVLANLKYLESNMDLLVTYSLSEVYPGTKIPNLPITYYPLNIVSPKAVMQRERPFKEKTGYGSGEWEV